MRFAHGCWRQSCTEREEEKTKSSLRREICVVHSGFSPFEAPSTLCANKRQSGSSILDRGIETVRVSVKDRTSERVLLSWQPLSLYLSLNCVLDNLIYPAPGGFPEWHSISDPIRNSIASLFLSFVGVRNQDVVWGNRRLVKRHRG